MTQEEFTNIFSTEFKGFTSRMWVDYIDETKGPFAQTDDYAGYVIKNFKYLIRKVHVVGDDLNQTNQGPITSARIIADNLEQHLDRVLSGLIQN